jgi:hypothetical protein
MTDLMLDIPRQQLTIFCHKWRIDQMALFGSALREDFRTDSDIDILVTFSPEATWSLFDHVTMQDELRHIFGRDVDLVTRSGIENSRNPIRKKAILNTAKIIYE